MSPRERVEALEKALDVMALLSGRDEISRADLKWLLRVARAAVAWREEPRDTLTDAEAALARAIDGEQS